MRGNPVFESFLKLKEEKGVHSPINRPVRLVLGLGDAGTEAPQHIVSASISFTLEDSSQLKDKPNPDRLRLQRRLRMWCESVPASEVARLAHPRHTYHHHEASVTQATIISANNQQQQ